MKKSLLILAFCFTVFKGFSTQHIVTNSGDSFSPSNLTIALGDTVMFFLGNTHNVRQVSQATWNANDTTALAGGVELPLTGGMWVPTSLGDHYYVCVPHASMGMKGVIHVSGVGVENSNSSVVFSLFPNPAVDFVNLSFTNMPATDVNYSLYNLAGQKIRAARVQVSGSQSIPVQVSDLPSGVYMMTVTYGTVQRTRRVVIQ